MLLRRITKHVNDQNWFAVFLDFVIVVFGVFMGFQVNNWNNHQQDSLREVVLLEQLNDEFSEIQIQLQEEAVLAQARLKASKYIVKLIDENAEPRHDEVKMALIRNMGLGRLPSTSATYRQLVSNGELTLINNDELRRALIKYHDTIDKNTFLFEITLGNVSEYIKTNIAVSIDVNAQEFSDQNADTITAIDWAGVREQRPYFVNNFIFNNLFNRLYADELAITQDVLALIDKNMDTR